MASNLAMLSADELVSKGIAPIKREFWKPAAPRQEVAAIGGCGPAERKSKRKAKQV